MRGDSHTNHENDHSGCGGKSPPAKPAAHPLKASRFLADIPHHIPGKEWRKRGLGSTAEDIPQLLVIFAIHSLQSIELSIELEVALQWQSSSQSGSFKEAFELPNTSWMPHLAQGLRFDLTDSLAGDLELPAHFFKGSAISIDQPKSLLQDLPFTICERLKHVLDFFLQ